MLIQLPADIADVPVHTHEQAAPGELTGSGQVTVSIIMLTFNRPQFIDRAIQSVMSQDFSAWELIIVDDGSLPETDKLIAKAARLEPRIRYFHRAKAGNIANATNFGLRQASGKYIAILDDDDFWSAREKLTKQVSLLELYPECAACGGGAMVINQDGRETLRYSKPENDAPLRRWALLSNPILHSTSMFRRALILKGGLYDETLPGFQDWDVFLKLGQLGELRNINETFISYTIWDGGGSFRGHRANTGAALRIVLRHRTAYQYFYPALLLAGLNYMYARLPLSWKRLSFSSLSRIKKLVFSNRRSPALSS